MGRVFSGVRKQILELLIAQSPDGLTMGEIRESLGLKPREQAQLGRRIRDLRSHYKIPCRRVGSEHRYFYEGELAEPLDNNPITARMRAEVLQRAFRRCQACGRNPTEDGIKLVVDHKIPREWGGATEIENLEALCEECNSGKKAYFASFDDSLMRKVLHYKSPRVRAGELLKLHIGEPVPDNLLELVVNLADWQKRIRDLRYMGWKIKASRRKQPGGRSRSYYTLHEFTEYPEDPDAWVAAYESADRAGKDQMLAEHLSRVGPPKAAIP